MAVAAVVVLAISASAPMAALVIGVILFGVLHNVLELRYVLGRFSGVLGRRFLELFGLLVSGVVVFRLLSGVLVRPSEVAEVVLGFVVLGLGAYHALDGRRRVVAWAVLAPAAVASLLRPDAFVWVLALLHLVVTVVFLWDWSSRLTVGRGLFRSVQLAWALAVPVVLLTGAADRWLGLGAEAVRNLVGDGQSVLAAAAPPGQNDSPLGLRFLVVVAFLQTMHYVVWVAFMPRMAPDVSAAFEARLPWLTGPRVWAAGFIGGAVLAVLFVFDFAHTDTLYHALSSYHEYLELPILLVLLVGGLRLLPVPDAAPEIPPASVSNPPDDILPYAAGPAPGPVLPVASDQEPAA